MMMTRKLLFAAGGAALALALGGCAASYGPYADEGTLAYDSGYSPGFFGGYWGGGGGYWGPGYYAGGPAHHWWGGGHADHRWEGWHAGHPASSRAFAGAPHAAPTFLHDVAGGARVGFAGGHGGGHWHGHAGAEHG